MNRRALLMKVLAGSAATLVSRSMTAITAVKTRNIVFVHGLFADGSCWTEVLHGYKVVGSIARRCKIR